MTLSHSLFVGLGLSIAACLAWTSQPAVPTPSSAAATAVAAPTGLTWTLDTQGWQGGNWAGGVTAAANHVEQGYSDWRLPTVPELQAALQIPAGQPGSWGVDTRNPDGSGRGWTSRSSGPYAYAVTIVKANSFVVPAQSGQSTKYLKTSNFASTKFVRP